jgi:hypothetical protein
MKEEEIIANLTHSYFDHLLRDIQPFIEYFDLECIQTYFKNSKVEVAEVAERIFFMACLHSKDVVVPFNYTMKCKIDHELKKQDWLSDIKPFGSKSKQGVVSQSLFFSNLYIVVKRAKNSKFDEITYRDFCVGINLNKILKESPFSIY